MWLFQECVLTQIIWSHHCLKDKIWIITSLPEICMISSMPKNSVCLMLSFKKSMSINYTLLSFYKNHFWLWIKLSMGDTISNNWVLNQANFQNILCCLVMIQILQIFGTTLTLINLCKLIWKVSKSPGIQCPIPQLSR